MGVKSAVDANECFIPFIACNLNALVVKLVLFTDISRVFLANSFDKS